VGLKKRHEITVLGHDYRACGTCLKKDVAVSGLEQPKIPYRDGLDAELLCQPLRHDWRQLRIQPDLHAANVG